MSTYLDHIAPAIAPWSLIVDVVSDASLKIRLFGTLLAESFGELTGANYLDYMPVHLRDHIGRSHRFMCDQPCGRLTHASAVTSGGREVVLGMVSLPLSHKGKIAQIVKLTRIIDSLDYKEGLSRVDHVFRQSWLDIGAGIPKDNSLAWG